ncbi:hypothetical protein CN481_17270 [Bacillus sp. AFS006103]|nr:hypothetical protein CN481_17270 [Bacillus sp. AFS006103]
MSKKFLGALLCLGLIAVGYFSTSLPITAPSPAPSPGSTSLEEKICAKVSAHYGDCKRVILMDTHSNLAFAESKLGILPVLISKDHTEIVKMIHPLLYFQEFKEEKVERGPISWTVRNNVQTDFSVISGFATNKAKTIIIKNKGDIIQPNKFFLRDNLWVWYITSKDKITLPLKVTVYDAKGHIISGGNEEE